MTDRQTTDAAARRWIDGYVRAWNSNDETDIRALFTHDAEYRTDPWREPFVGADAIAAEWIARKDDAGSFSFEGDVESIDGRMFSYAAVTRYDSGTVYSNLWVVRLDEGLARAESFTEWWMDQSDPS